MTIMFSWNYGTQKKYKYVMEKKLSPEDFTGLVANVRCRVPGVCFLCSDLLHGLPPILRHYVNTVGSLNEILIILTIRILPVKTVLLEERFLVGKLGFKGVYRCLAQYGYLDVPILEGNNFLNQVIEIIKDHIKMGELSGNQGRDIPVAEHDYSAYEEMQQLELARDIRAVFVLGKTKLRTNDKTGVVERFIVDKLYRFLQNNSRSAMSTLRVPPEQLLQVGMLCEI